MAEATTETDILLHGVGAKIICVHITYMYSLSLFLPPYLLAGNITVGGRNCCYLQTVHTHETLTWYVLASNSASSHVSHHWQRSNLSLLLATPASCWCCDADSWLVSWVI